MRASGIAWWLRGVMAALTLVATVVAHGQTARHAYMSAAMEPWDDPSNLLAMEAAFGSDWTRLQYGDAFDSYSLLYIDGGSTTAAEMVSFLDIYRGVLENYVQGGGRLFINAATEGQTTFDLVFGATSTQVDDTFKSLSASAVDPSNSLFDGAGTSWNGYFFAHNNIAAPGSFSDLITGDQGGSVLVGGFFGDGYVMLGGQTNTLFHEPVNGSDPFQLRVNELRYAANVAPPPVVSPVPEPEMWLMSAIGLAVVVGAQHLRQRRRANGQHDRSAAPTRSLQPSLEPGRAHFVLLADDLVDRSAASPQIQHRRGS